MSIESTEDLAGMRRVGHVVAMTLREMRTSMREGMSTGELDDVGATVLRRHGAVSAPKRIYGFPGHTCISLNDEIVHGIPGNRVLHRGDIVKIDVTAELGGYIADAATTVLLPPVDPEAVRLKNSAVAALKAACDVAKHGRLVSIIGRAVESRARRDGFAVARGLCGHGVGRHIHEPPDVPNYENQLSRDRLTLGLVIAVEPMLLASPSRAVDAGDGWTVRTENGCAAVHEEHTIVITRGAPIVVTA